jgi:putative transcriptional regulator
MSSFFDELMQSVQQMDEIRRGERQPSRQFVVDALSVKEIRKSTGLSQVRFAEMIDVQIATLRNWEQGRRVPTGPAKALLRAIHNDPIHVIGALRAQQTDGTAQVQ